MTMKHHTPDVLMIGSPYRKGDGVFDATDLFRVHFVEPEELSVASFSEHAPKLIVLWPQQDLLSTVLSLANRSAPNSPISILVVGPSSQASYFLEAGAAYFVDEAAPTAVLLRGIEVMLGVFSVRPMYGAAHEIRTAVEPLHVALEEAALAANVERLSDDIVPRVPFVQHGLSLKGLIETLEGSWLRAPVQSGDAPASEGLESVDLQGYVAPREQVDEQRSEPPDAVLDSASGAPPPAPPSVSELAEQRSVSTLPPRAAATPPAEDEGVKSELDAIARSLMHPVDKEVVRVERDAAHVSTIAPTSANQAVTRDWRAPAQQLSSDAHSPTEEWSVAQGGSLSEMPVWQLFARLVQHSYSGQLTLSRREVQRIIPFENGTPLMVASNARGDRLIELLFREGRLSAEQYASASETIAVSGRRAGVVMMDQGWIAPRELFPLVRYHYEYLLGDALFWSEGTYQLAPLPEPLREPILLDVSGVAVLVEAFRTHASEALLNRLLPPETVLQHGAAANKWPLDDFALLPQELACLQDVNGERSLQRLAQRGAIPVHELQSALVPMLLLEWLQVRDEATPDAESAPPPLTDAVVVSEMSGTLPERASDAAYENEVGDARARVVQKMAQVHEGTYFTILEVGDTAASYEVRKAYQRLKAAFQLELFAIPELADLRSDVTVIGKVLDEAFDVLRDDARREAYRRAHV